MKPVIEYDGLILPDVNPMQPDNNKESDRWPSTKIWVDDLRKQSGGLEDAPGPAAEPPNKFPG